MKKEWQQSAHDCFGACIASIVGISTKDVPLFVTMPMTYIQRARRWLRRRGFVLSQMKDIDQLDRRRNAIVAVDPFMYEGFQLAHATVVRNKRVVHDPARKNPKKHYKLICGWEIRKV